MPKKWPRCLNTGNFVGRVSTITDLLNRTCIPCRSGLHADEVFRRYARAYSAQAGDWVYSEQAELMRLYLQRPPNESGWVLDFQQVLFHPNYWFSARADVRVLADGRLENRHTSSAPAFVHYNGDSKRTWHGEHAPVALERALRRSYAARLGSARAGQLEAYVRERVSFLGPTFARDRGVGLREVCGQGSIGGH